jgi:hypothetical protein
LRWLGENSRAGNSISEPVLAVATATNS